MKVNVLEAHDRLQFLKQDQSANVFQGAEDCLKVNSLSLALQDKCPYIYIFAHPRTADDGVNKVLYWQPRLSIPKPQTNSYLFRALSKTDIIEVCWLLPPREMWEQYEKGKVTEDNWTAWSIEQFKNNRSILEKPHHDDLPEYQGKKMLKQVINEHIQKIRSEKKAALILNGNMWSTPRI
jgi:hypothetical protein